MADRKYKLITKSSAHAAFYVVTGSVIEKSALKAFLTVTNKSVWFQLNKAQDLLTWWKERVSQLEGYGKVDGASLNKLEFYAAQVKSLKELAIVRYWEEIVDCDTGIKELYIPKGFWYLFENEPGDARNDIEAIHMPWSRPYQIECVNDMMKYKRSICSMSTGSGKSILILNLALSYIKAGKRVMVIVPSDYLVGQVLDTIKPHHDNVTAVGGGRKPKLGADVMVSTAQSAKQYADVFDVLIQDEAHHLSAKTWQDIMAESNAEYVHALSATAYRNDGTDLGLNAFAGPIVHQKEVDWFIREGWLMEPNIFQVHMQTESIPDGKMATTAYKKTAESLKVLGYIKEQLIKSTNQGRRTIVVFKTISPGQKLKKMLSNDIKFQVATGDFKKPLDDFKAGLCPVLVGTAALISEGIDIPDADCLIIVTQHSSKITTYQVLGRVMRLSKDKKQPIVLDICFTGYKQFANSVEKRSKEYKKITKNFTQIKG